MRRPTTSALIFAAVLAAGCAKEKGDDHVKCDAPGGCSAVHSTLGTNENRVELIPDGDGGVYAALYGSGFEAACAGGVVCHGELWRIDRFGDVEWKSKERKSVAEAFLVDGGVGYVTGAGKVVVLDADGDERFTHDTGGATDITVSVVSGALLVVANGSIVRLDVESGEELWSSAAPEERHVPAIPTGDGYALTMGFDVDSAGLLVARTFDLDDGAEGWTAELPAQLSAPMLIPGFDDETPVLLVSDRLSLRGWGGGELWGIDGAEGYRFVSPSRTNGFFAGGPYFDQVTEYRANGTVAWSRPMPAAVTWVSATPDGHVLVGQADGVVRKLKGNEGITLWDYGDVDTVKAQAPPLYGTNANAVFWGANIGSESDTHISTVTPFGQGLERWDAGARIVSAALSNDDDVFSATADGRIYLREAAEF